MNETPHTRANLTCHPSVCSQKLFAEALAPTGLKFEVVPYVMPGFGLARATSAAFERADDDVSVLVLLKHGLFTWGATAKVAKDAGSSAWVHTCMKTAVMYPSFTPTPSILVATLTHANAHPELVSTQASPAQTV